MKKIIILVLASLISMASFSQTPNLKIFFLNGIKNSKYEAQESASALQQVISSLTGNVVVESIYNPMGKYAGTGANGVCDTYDPATASLVIPANPAFGTGPLVPLSVRINRATPCVISDFGELGASKVNEENYRAEFLNGFVVGNNPQNYSRLTVTKANNLINTFFLNEKKVVRVTAQLVEKRIRDSVRSGNKVLLVAHSQGNLIANWAWIRLAASLTSAELANIRILNVANTSRLSVHGADITHNKDFQITVSLPVLGKIYTRDTPDCQPSIGTPNSPASCNFRVGLATYELGANEPPDTHSFYSAYLSGLAVTKVSNRAVTTFADAMYATVRELLEGLGSIVVATPPAPANIPPTASFTPSASSAAAGAAITFNASASTDADGSIASYAWRFGDGATGTGVNASHAYASVGSYTVTLTVTDNSGAMASAVRIVNITATRQPDLIPSAVTVTPASVPPGGVVTVAWQIANSGNANAAASTTGLRLVSAATSGNGAAADNLLNVPTGALAAGGVANQSQALTIPAGTAPGSYVVVVVADNVAASTLGQSNVNNDLARSSVFTVAASLPVTTNSTVFTDPFDGTALQTAVWTAAGGGTTTVANGSVSLSCFAKVTTAGKLTFSGQRLVVESGFFGVGHVYNEPNNLFGKTLWDTAITLTDVATGDRIVVGDTNYFDGGGLYLIGTGIFNTPQFGNGVSSNTYMEYRLTVNGNAVKLERGTSLANISDSIDAVLPTSIAGKSFHLTISTGGPDYCPSEFNWITVKSFP